MNELAYIASRIAFGEITADEIQKTVNALLVKGVYCDHFVAIIDSKPPTLGEVLPPFTAYLKEQGVTIPTKDEAVWQIIAYHCSRITSGIVDPLAGLQQLIKVIYWNYDFHKRTKHYLGDSHGLEHLIGLYWGYDDMMARPQEI